MYTSAGTIDFVYILSLILFVFILTVNVCVYFPDMDDSSVIIDDEAEPGCPSRPPSPLPPIPKTPQTPLMNSLSSKINNLSPSVSSTPPVNQRTISLYSPSTSSTPLGKKQNGQSTATLPSSNSVKKKSKKNEGKVCSCLYVLAVAGSNE